MIAITMDEVVESGAKLLDEQHPGWFTLIDRARLNMWRPDDCILGQLYGSYAVGLSNLNLGEKNQFEYGFSLYEAGTSYVFKFLTDAWDREIAKRLDNIK